MPGRRDERKAAGAAIAIARREHRRGVRELLAYLSLRPRAFVVFRKTDVILARDRLRGA